MEKEFIPFELAVKLKEMGFDEHCLGFYESDGTFTLCKIRLSENSLLTRAPLWQQAFDWFREQHNLHGDISFRYQYYVEYTVNVFNIKGFPSYFVGCFRTNKEAIRACVEYLIELAK